LTVRVVRLQQQLLVSMLKGSINSAARTRPTTLAACGWLFGALCFAASWGYAATLVRAEVYFTVRELLAQQFKSSERVSFIKVRPSASQRQAIERRLGKPLAKPEYVVYVAKTGERDDGYALFDEERGQHELISFGTFFDAAGLITRLEVLAYREPFGDGVRAERFRRQFIGRGAQSAFVLNRDIDAISGATISSRSLCTGVFRASVLLDLAVRRPAALASQSVTLAPAPIVR
jgi:Na+-translocating ferredoxin:NAD+ oxidoreductase RnfG subunit